MFEGKRAVGVEYLLNDKVDQARANAEVVVSMGPLNSPKLLLLSGIGPAEQLKKYDIPVLVESAGVGENLQDHLNVRMCWESKVEQQIPMIICESSMFTFTRDGRAERLARPAALLRRLCVPRPRHRLQHAASRSCRSSAVRRASAACG